MKGTVYATDGSFTGELNIGGGNFYVDKSGNVTMKGSINMSDGAITWSAASSPTKVLYATSALSTPSGSYGSFPSTSATTWHKTLSSNDFYASYSYDGGATWTAAIRIIADASYIPSYIHETYIDSTEIRSPSIITNLLTLQTPSVTTSSSTSGLLLKGYLDGTLYDVFKIWYAHDSIPPTVTVESPCDGKINLCDIDSLTSWGNDLRLTGNLALHGDLKLYGASSASYSTLTKGMVARMNYYPSELICGTGAIQFGSASTSAQITFPNGYTFSSIPQIIVEQRFQSTNILVPPGDITTTGFKATLGGGLSGTGSREFGYVAFVQ